MNNPWFRVTITNEGDFLRFEHPTLPGYQAGGWMERVKKAGGNLTNGYWGESIGDQDIAAPTAEVSQISMVQKDLKNSITIEDLRKHDNKDSPWFVVNGEVYDGTKFLEGHPGGATSIISAAGVDSTDEFMAIRMLPFQFSNIVL
jgi:nitrate reductase (NAD(P)H)